MALNLAAGSIGTIRVAVLSLTNGTASIEVIDNNNQPVVGPADIPSGLITPTEQVVALGDVMVNLDTQVTEVVRWIGADGLTWSPAVTGAQPQNTVGWQKIGTFTLPT
jgi:hypothetical protein